MKNRIFGEWILVEKELVKQTALDKTGEFKGVVKILGIGGNLKNTSLKEGDRVRVGSNPSDINGESYISEHQILRWEE